MFEIGCSILDHWGRGGIIPDHMDLHSALLWNRKDPALFCDIMPVLKLAHVDISHSEIVMSALSVPFILSLSAHSVLLSVHSGDHPENPFSCWQKQNFLYLLFSYLALPC